MGPKPISPKRERVTRRERTRIQCEADNLAGSWVAAIALAVRCAPLPDAVRGDVLGLVREVLTDGLRKRAHAMVCEREGIEAGD